MKSVLLLAMVLGYIGACFFAAATNQPVTRVYADHNRWLPGIPTPVMNRGLERGFVTYRLDTNSASYPGFRADATKIALAGLTELGIEAIEVTSGTPDIWLTMPSDASFITICGQGAAGCVEYWGEVVFIYFRRALLYKSYDTTIAHEGLNYGHTFGEHEQYFDSNGQFACDVTRFDTVMSCGTGVWYPQPYDIATVHEYTLPKRLKEWGMGFHPDGTPYVFYGNADSQRGRRVALMVLDPQGGYHFSGIYLPVGPGYFGVNIIPGPGYCFYFNVENGFNYKQPKFRNDQLVGCT